MTSAVEFINRWQRIALLSHSLLELAQRGDGTFYWNRKLPICKVLKWSWKSKLHQALREVFRI